MKLLAILAGLLTSVAAFAADSPASAAADPAEAIVEQARSAIKKQDWHTASSLLREALQVSQSADVHNLYAYSLRKGANPDMNLVFKHYNEALKIDPKHRGAHEYIGEAYLMVGNVAKAKEHLATLDRLCFFPCSEHADLKKAISAYEQKR